MGISIEFYSDKNDINFNDVNANLRDLFRLL